MPRLCVSTLVLAASAYTSPARATTDAVPLASIPFETHGNLIVMRMKPDHLPTLTILFDTGSSNTVIDSSAAHRLDLELETRPVESQGAGGQGQSWLALEPLTFRIGDARIEADGVTVIDLADLSARVGRRLDGIIGGDALTDHIVRIDYAAGRLDLLPPDAHRPEREAIHIGFRYGIPTMKARVLRLDGRIREGRFFIDTGASRSAVLGARFAKRAGLPEPDVPRIHLTSRGAHQSFRSQVTRIGRLDLGPFELGRPLVLLSEARGGILADRETAGVIGGAALRRFTVTIDTRARRMHLDPNDAFDEYDEFDASGMQLQAVAPDYETIVVSGVIPDSPAAEQGIMEGDTIVALDGQPLADRGLEWLRTQLRAVGTDVTLELSRAGARHVARLKLRHLL